MSIWRVAPTRLGPRRPSWLKSAGAATTPVSQTAQPNIEWLQSLTGPAAAVNLEWLRSLTSPIDVNLEWYKSGLSQTGLLNAEWLQALTGQTSLVNLEWLQRLQPSSDINLEFLQALTLPAELNLEWYLPGISQVAEINLEKLRTLIHIPGINSRVWYIEFLQGITSPTEINIEWESGSVHLDIPGLIPIGWLQALSIPGELNPAWTQQLAMIAAINAEWSLALSAQTSLIIEFLQGIRALPTIPIEWLQRLAILTDVNLEWLARLSGSTSPLNLEWLLAVSTTIATQLEALQDIQQPGQINIEWDSDAVIKAIIATLLLSLKSAVKPQRLNAIDLVNLGVVSTTFRPRLAHQDQALPARRTSSKSLRALYSETVPLSYSRSQHQVRLAKTDTTAPALCVASHTLRLQRPSVTTALKPARITVRTEGESV